MDETVRQVLGRMADLDTWEDRGDRLWRAEIGAVWYYILFSADVAVYAGCPAAPEFVDGVAGAEEHIRREAEAEIQRMRAEVEAS